MLKEPPWPLGNYAYGYWPRDRVISCEPRGREKSVAALQSTNVEKKKKTTLSWLKTKQQGKNNYCQKKK